ncbi:MAG: AraC family transcriptional regulator [Cyanobacteriota bacterium]|nr:AraC family transcriptional regulator [Cyanobacteriota bacterium]
MVQRFNALALPLNNLPVPAVHGIADLPPQAQDAIGTDHAISVIRATGGLCQMPVFKVGTVTCFAGRVTPTLLHLEANPEFAVHLAYSGRACFDLGKGPLLLTPERGFCLQHQAAIERIGFGTGIGFQLSADRLGRTLRAMSGRDLAWAGEQGRACYLGSSETAAYRSLFALVDQLLLDDPLIPQMLGLDEQLYRLAAVHQLREMGLDGLLAERASDEARGSGKAVMERLLAYIEDHADAPLSLTDLESHSGYSARRLQQLFRQQFGCSPMQHVRRQRLQRALRRLEHPQAGDTVISVARSVGYRQLGQFSSDFRAQFSCLPSAVLRSGRVGQTTAMALLCSQP